MRRAKNVPRKGCGRDRKTLASHSNQVRRRVTEFKLESLEERRLLSTTTKVYPSPMTPEGLGVVYTGLSEQAHGIGSASSSPAKAPSAGTTTTTTSPFNMAELEAYLKKLTGTLPMRSDVAPDASPSDTNSSPGQSDSGGDGGEDDDHPDDAGSNALGQEAYLWALEHNPSLITGLSKPPLLPTAISGFDGMNFLDSVNGYVPPDTNIAVGPNAVVEVVNAQIQVYDKSTGTALLPNTPLNTFFGQSSESPFDPVVTYDDIAGRFIVSSATSSGDLLLAVSKDSNPLDGFTSYDINASEGGFFGDFPKLGWNNDEVVITENMYPGPGNFHVQVLSFATSSLFASTPPATLTIGKDYFSYDRTNNDLTLVPAPMHGAKAGAPMYFVEENTYEDGANLRVVSATNLLSNSPNFTDTVIPVAAYTAPPPAQQPDGAIQTNDSEVISADYRDGLLVAGQNVGLATDGDAHARWYEFNVSGTPTLAQQGTIAPAPGVSTYFPAIAIGAGDVIGMTYNQSSLSQYPSVYDTGRTPADIGGTMETPVLAHAGTATYSDFAFRWGDYSGIAVDPSAPGTFWSGAEYSTSTLSGLPANWATWISHFAVAPVVISSTPAAQSVQTGTAPTTFSLTFSEPIDKTSIIAGSFKVNGVAATTASLSANGLTITYTFAKSPVTQPGTESMSLPAGSVKGQGDEQGNAAFSASFYYTPVQLKVTGTSPAVGSILAAPVTDLVVLFNQPFNPYSISTSDFQLSQGTVASAKPLTSQSVELTLSGVTQDGTLTLAIPAGAILDTNQVPGAAFSGTYIVQVSNQPFPSTFQGVPPAGSLIYDPTATGAINFTGDTDTYTLALAANQTLTVVMTTSSSLQGTITVTDPNNKVIGTATASALGQTVMLIAPVTTAGTYSFTVSGASGTQGNYTVQAILNAVYKPATGTNNSTGTAYDLTGAFASLGTTPSSDRAGVIGTIDAAGDPDVYAFHLNVGQSATLAAQGQNGNVGLELLDSNGIPLALPAQAGLAGPLDFSSGFTGAASQMTVNGSATISGSNLQLTDGGFSEAGSAFTNAPRDVSKFSTSFNFQLTPGTDPLADGFTFTIQGIGSKALGNGGGDLGYGGIGQSVAIKFDLYDNVGEGTDSTGIYTDGADPYVPAVDLTGTGIDLHSGDVFNVQMTYDGTNLNVTITDTSTNASASQSYPINIPATVGSKLAYVGFTGGTGGLSAVQDIQGWTFTPASTGVGLAPFESINDFVALSAGTYYAVVTGNSGANYSLVVTRGADFVSQHNNAFDNAQPLDGVNTVLGAIVKGQSALQALDNTPGTISPIYQTDPVTGAFGPSVPSPVPAGFFLFGQNMASDGTYTYYDDGYGSSGTIYKLDSSGAVVGSFTPSNGGNFTGLAYLNGKLYANAAFDSNIYIFDAATFAPLGAINTGDGAAWTGLAGDPSRGVLWAVAQTGGFDGEIDEIDPRTGNIIKSGGDNAQGAFEQDIAYANGVLIVSDEAGVGPGFNFLDEYDPDTLGFIQRLTPNYQGSASGLAGDGLGGLGSDWYQFNVNAGDNLVITTTTPGATAASGQQFVNQLQPTINLYDANGNLVATATGNAADGRNDVIDWTALSSGSYRVQILGSSKTNLGEYTISIQGATGGLSPFQVTSTSPAAGSDINSQASSMTVSLNDSVLLTSVSTSDLTIDGQNATGVTVLDSHTISFNFPTTADGVHSVSISGLKDIHGATLTPDNFTFKTDTTPPHVVLSSLVDGSTFSPAPQSVTEVVTFSEPMNTTLTPSFDLFGQYRNVHYTAATFSWDPTGTALTINYSNLPSDAYQFTLSTSGFQDLAGNTLVAGLTTNFSVTVGTTTISGLKAVKPQGSLVYQGTADDVLVSSSDIATYDLTIDPRQTIALLVMPVTSGMTITVTLTAPDHTVTTATAPQPGAPVLIPAVQSPNGGTYVIQVSGGPGEYKLQTDLNALIDPAAYGGPPDGTIGAPQPLDEYTNTFASGADRTAVLGSILGTPASFGDALVVEFNPNSGTGDVILIDQSTGAILNRYTSPAFAGNVLFDVALASDNTFYVLCDVNTFTGLIVHMDLQGDTLGTITVPISDPGALLSPEGFGLDPRDGSFWIPLTNSGTLVHIDSSGSLLNQWFIGGSMNDAAVGPDGLIYITQVSSGFIQTFDPSTGNTGFFASSPFPLNLTWSAAGDLWVGDIFNGVEEFDGFGNLINQIPDFAAISAEPAPSGNIWEANGLGVANQFTPTGSLLTQTPFTAFQPGLAVLGDVPNEAPLPPPVNPVYSIHLDAGQSASFIIRSLNQQAVGLTLMDGSGNVLALSSTGATNYTAGINNFVARTGDTYYVQVTGNPGANFNLVVTRNADFDTEKNSSIPTAQAFDGNGAILGSTTKGTTPFFVLDDNPYSPPFPIWVTDPNTGLFFVPSIPAPATEPNNPFGLNMAYDGTNLYYNDGANFGTNTIYKLEPSTGNVLASFVPPGSVPPLTGLAWFDGNLYASDSFDNNGNLDNSIFEFSGTTFQLINTFSTGITAGVLEGLAGDPDRGVLWGVTQGASGNGSLYEIDPNSGAVLKSATDASNGLFEQDLAYAGGMLIVSDTNNPAFAGGTNVLDEYDPDTLSFVQRLPVAVQGLVSGLAGDGLGTAADDVDYYSVNAQAGDMLTISTTTPGGGPGEFANGLYPALTLYDSNGNFIDSKEGNAPDGRNSVLTFHVTADGTYYIEVSQADNTSTPTVGEYGLVVSGATGGLPAMAVASTTPANGALVQPPTTYTVVFSQPVYAPSLSDGDFTINGKAASSLTLVDAHTVTWTIPAGVIPVNQNRGSNTVVITGVQDISGATMADFTSKFTTDDVAPTVIDSSIANGHVFSPAPANVTEVVTFSEPMNTAFTTTASFDLHGSYRNADEAPASFSWSPDGTKLTINYVNVPDDTYTLTLFAAGFQDLVGHPLASNDTVNFAVALGTAALPTPFQPTAPLGSQIYSSSDTHVLVAVKDVDTLTVNINPGQVLSVVVAPAGQTLQPVITVLDTKNHVIATATAPAAGQSAVVETVPISTGGVYTIQVKDANGNLGLYTIQATLNAFVKTGTTNISIGTAQGLNDSAISLGGGAATQLAAVGTIVGGPAAGDAYVAARFTSAGPEILRVDGSGNIAQTIAVNDPLLSLSGLQLDPANNLLYAAVTTSFNASSVSGELMAFNPATGKEVAVVTLPDDPANIGYYYPFGFSIATDGTFWVAQLNSNNIIHVDAVGHLLSSFSTGNVQPQDATIRPDGKVSFNGYGPDSSSTGLYLLNPSLGIYALVATQPSPVLTKVAATGGVWSGDFFNGAQRFDDAGNLLQTVGYFGSVQAQTDPSGNIWTSNFAAGDLFRFDPGGNQQIAASAPGALGLTVWGVDNPNAPPPDTQDFYSFTLTAGQSATIVVESLNGKSAGVLLEDSHGNVLVSGVGGSTNVSQSIQNFVASTAGKYYVEVTGDQGLQYSLVVTRGASFNIEPNDTYNQAQPLTGTNGVAGAIAPGGDLRVGLSLEGADFLDGNCGCYPPDTNAAVGSNYVVEGINTTIRVYDKTTGSILLDESLAIFYGQPSGGDVYVVYDDLADRWYVSSFSGDFSLLLLAVSRDGNPLDGFLPTYVLNGTAGLPDYNKMGFNKDAIFISYNDGGTDGFIKIDTIDKAAALSGTLSEHISRPEDQFQAMPPAQFHGDTTGGVEWFISTDGTNDGGTSIRVTKMTNYLSASPTFTYYSLPVQAYQYATHADQPGGFVVTDPNTTTTQVDYRNGRMVTALSSADASDGFDYIHVHYYEVDVSSGTPTLILEGSINPGPGVATQMGSAALDASGNIGLTWMQSSATEYVSMYIGTVDHVSGAFSSFDAAPGLGFAPFMQPPFNVGGRIGDYSSVVLDPTDGKTFWAANEYMGADGFNDIFNTHLTSFSLPSAVDNEWYTINVQAGKTLTLQSYTPSTQGGQYPNSNPVLNIQLYDTFGNLVASGTTNADGHNQTLTYKASIAGQYHILVFNKSGTSGEYFLQVTTPAYNSGAVTGQVINDLNGDGKLAGDPGLDNWEVDVYSGKVKVASQLTHGGGTFDFEGLPTGTYLVTEVLQAGWTQTAPAGGSFSVAVKNGQVVSGLQFGDFQNITIAGLAYNDLSGDGAQEPGDPGLAKWSIQLVNSAGKVVATATTEPNGNYSFTNVGPGTYTVKEVLKSGWIQTSSPTSFTVTAASGQNVGGLAFGDFQLVTYSGTVYNDLNGNGAMDPGEKPLNKWTINLLNSIGTVVATVTTNGTGTYSFPNIGPGKWTIQEVNQSGWYQTQPANPPGIYSFASVSGANQSGLNFGNFQVITLSGSVYNDVKGDGKKQGNDPGLANWTVELLNTSGNVVAKVTTDSKGNYSIGPVFPGTFKLVEILQSGWVQIQPGNPPAYAITPRSGQNQSGLDFGVHKTTASSPTATIGLSSIATTGNTNGPIADLGTSSNAAPSGLSNASATTASATVTAAPAAPTVSLIGTNPTPLRVVYNQGTQPVQYTPAAPLVDVALGVVSTRVRARQTIVTDQAIGALAGALLGDDEGDAS